MSNFQISKLTAFQVISSYTFEDIRRPTLIKEIFSSFVNLDVETIPRDFQKGTDQFSL